MEYKEHEKKIMLPLIKDLKNNYESDFLIEWESGTKIIGKCCAIFDSDNDLLPSDSNYEEFWATWIKINKIIVYGEELGLDGDDDKIVEITYHNQPKSWKKI